MLEILGPKKRVMGVSYIPSERTRTLLAQIDPLARVAIVSTFPEFLPIMKAGVQRFAPHVHDIRATLLESPDLAEVLQRAEVVVYACGSERVAGMLPPETPSFEYRHTPDPREIDQVLLPMLEEIRGAWRHRRASPAASPSGGPMRIKDMNWMQVEDYLKRDDRAVLPMGSTEQHAQLSLMVDCILSERVSVDAAEPTGVPVFPPVNYGITPYFRAFPGTVSLRIETFLKVVEDILDSLAEQGFRRILIVNGHGGNAPAQTLAQEWMTDHPGIRVKFHNWYNAPKTWAKVKEIDPVASHASWMENFPWTRLRGVVAPSQQKPMVDFDKMRGADRQGVRAAARRRQFRRLLRAQPTRTCMALWAVAVEETRDVIEIELGMSAIAPS